VLRRGILAPLTVFAALVGFSVTERSVGRGGIQFGCDAGRSIDRWLSVA